MTGETKARVESLAESLVLAEAGDSGFLSGLLARFEEIAQGPHDRHGDAVAALCGMAAESLRRCLADGGAVADGTLAMVNRCAACLQGIVCEGLEPEEVRMPEGIEEAGRPAPSENPLQEQDVTDADPSLLSDFVRESMEHFENADLLLMGLESNPGDGEALNGIFRAFHTIKGVAGFLGFKGIQAFAHGTENLLDLVRQGSLSLDARIVDVAFEAVDVLRKRIQWAAAHGGAAAPAPLIEEMRLTLARVEAAAQGRPDTRSAPAALPAEPGMRLGEILVASGTVSPETVETALRAQSGSAVELPLGEALVKHSGVPAREVAQALAGQKKAQEAASSGVIKETVKVEADRLDRLLDAIGELVIAEAMIFQTPEIKAIRNPMVAKRMVTLDKITRDLQKMGTSLRMVPIRPVFQKMAKLSRDLARKAGKEVEFACTGEETELDKTVVDKIGDPLVHMVRNSIDHGIEPEAGERTAAGKRAQAKVTLSAFQKGGNVCIRIEDDGRGLNREAILRKARERGLLQGDGADLADRDVWNFIFEAGFSTAAKLTEISGRGVGMDVVRRNIEELRGRIEIESAAGRGTVFSIWLPLTMAIIDGMIVKVSGQRFVIPTLSILRIVPLREEDRLPVLGRGKMLSLHGELVPLFELSDYVPGCVSGSDATVLAVIVECGERKAGIIVDELLGQQQVVVKGLGESLKQVPGLSGGAILPDGTVGMILDVDGLLQTLKSAPAAA